MLGVVPSCAPSWLGQSRSIINPLKWTQRWKKEDIIYHIWEGHIKRKQEKERKKQRQKEMWACQGELLTNCHADHHKGRRCFRGVHDSETLLRLIAPQKSCVFVHALTCLTVDQQQKKHKNQFWISFQIPAGTFMGTHKECLLLRDWLKSNFLVYKTSSHAFFFFFCLDLSNLAAFQTSCRRF